MNEPTMIKYPSTATPPSTPVKESLPPVSIEGGGGTREKPSLFETTFSVKKSYMESSIGEPLSSLPLHERLMRQGIREGELTTTSSDEATMLQKHVQFFDRNGDGVIMPWETYGSFRELGYSLPITLMSVFMIHSTFSYPSLNSWAPDPFFGIELANIHKCKHGSDTGIFDHTGNLDMYRFTEMFGPVENQFALKNQYCPTMVQESYGFWDIWKLTTNIRSIWDWYGWIASRLQWGLLYLLTWSTGLYKDMILEMLDGSLFTQQQRLQSQMMATPT